MKNHEIVAEALDGEEAVKIFKRMKKCPDIIIMDHRMPFKNGLNAMKEIHAINPMQSVIFVTADYEAAKESVRIGASSFVMKPFRMDDLFNSIEVALSDQDRKRSQLKESLLKLITKFNSGGNSAGHTTICDDIEKSVLNQYLPEPVEKDMRLDSLGPLICDFFNYMGLEFSCEVNEKNIILRNQKCHWMEALGPNPHFCFTTRCMINRLAGKTGMKFDLETKKTIMDGSDECKFELAFH